MRDDVVIREADAGDYQGWLPLWEGYNAFYGREGETALPEAITRQTWARFLDGAEPMTALVAEREGRLIGLAHAIRHRSSTRLADVCYLQDLFTLPEARGRGVARALIDAVCRLAKATGCDRVYWQTHQTNHTARALYDKVAEHKGFIVYGRDLQM
ncbi:GNAT family N-acetyltransferase [Chromobacterium phragmitis]|uniref:GNAT family N-acetyltransferase n=1 Tax=Chromobacterium phragmitis TaxID=2202141 RepID=A0ABV0IT40_9NEIS|nr:GNAT family N-acetyltransferase [Chromobacterium phragmitis]AXE30695.1 GNAT family N-acetyltransferase [Chromobacterium phragmitis]